MVKFTQIEANEDGFSFSDVYLEATSVGVISDDTQMNYLLNKKSNSLAYPVRRCSKVFIRENNGTTRVISIVGEPNFIVERLKSTKTLLKG